MTERSDPTSPIIRVLVAILCGAAFLLIVVILSGERIDDTSGKAIGTAFGFAFFSLSAMAGLSLHDRPPPRNLFGYAVAAVSLAAFLSGAFALWSDPGGDGWELPGVLFVLGLGGGHAATLLKSAREEDTEGVRALRAGVLLTIAVICVLATSEISSNGEDFDPRLLGVLAVLYLLGTLLLPLIRRGSATSTAMRAAPRTAPELLRANGHALVEGPVPRGGVHGAGENVCLREPDGTLVELITYEASAGT